MNLKNKQIIIIGGGYSLKEGIEKGLWKQLTSKFTIGLNYSYNFFDSTMLCYVDKDFYEEQCKDLSNLPLIIGKEHKKFKPLSNTVMLKCTPAYHRNIKQGVYKSSLVGLFALSLAIYLLDEGEVYLLGYDYGGRPEKDKKGRSLTHFYQGQLDHRGVGKTKFYDAKFRVDKDLGVYSNEKKVKIYNVSLISRINIFPKISYDDFFTRLRKETNTQDQLRQYVREKLA
jgi:hypothetical protein